MFDHYYDQTYYLENKCTNDWRKCSENSLINLKEFFNDYVQISQGVTNLIIVTNERILFTSKTYILLRQTAAFSLKVESISHSLNLGWCSLFWLWECNRSDTDRAPILSLKRLALLGTLSASCVWAQASLLEGERPHGGEQRYSSWQAPILANSLKIGTYISKLVLDYPAPSQPSSWL